MATKMAGSSPTSSAGIAGVIYRLLSKIPTWTLWLIVLLWTVPSFSLFVNGFRERSDQRNNGFWTFFTDAVGISDINASGATLNNYRQVFSADATAGMAEALGNSFAVAIPATIIPISFAAFAAYAFAWIDFKGREWMFIGTVSLLAIPLQVALIPLLKLYVGGAHLTIPFTEKTMTLIPDLGLSGTTTAVWLTHTGFAMPFAIFLLHNYIQSLPSDVFEAARIDGADHFTIFWRIVLPLSVPVIAAFGIFQFLWTYNGQHHGWWQPGLDYLHDASGQPGWRLRRTRTLALGGGLRAGGGAAARVLLAAAVLRPRPVGGFGQGLGRSSRGTTDRKIR
jgi:alpha-glucoside transport system permease protein